MIPLNVWLLAGQSNAMGGGNQFDGSALTPGLCDEGLLLSHHHDNKKAGSPFSSSWGGLRADGRGAFGLYAGFQRRMMEAGRRVAASSFCVGGSSLHRGWIKAKNKLYPQAVEYWLDEIAALQDAGFDTRIEGLLWGHGERDAGDEQSYLGYATRLYGLIADLRADLGAPTMRVVAPLLHPREGDEDADRIFIIRENVTDLARDADLRLSVFETADLSLQTDGLHYTAGAMLELGRRCAEVVL